MNSSIVNLDHYRSDNTEETQLGQVRGAQGLFHNRYEVCKVLGRGGFGITFLARDTVLPAAPLCVIKQLSPKVNDPVALERARQRFEQEAKTLARLGSHAQIPYLLDYFELGGEFYLVQEYVHGLTLSKTVRRNGAFTEGEVKRFLREIMPVLNYVHENRVIHRDIKPPNILRCKDDDRLVLIDFGAVKERIVQASDLTCRPATTQFVGTVGFAPPEQLASRPVYASDLFAIGITCLYLLSGKPPGEFEYELATGELRWWKTVQVSEHFHHILGKLLKPSMHDRYQSAREVLRALELEPYLDNLLPCMTLRPRPGVAVAQGTDVMGDRYLSPTERRAMAIRIWNARLKTKNPERQPMLTT
jgi:serine/threonine protein kinase